eukprot:gene20291-31226_t
MSFRRPHARVETAGFARLDLAEKEARAERRRSLQFDEPLTRLRVLLQVAEDGLEAGLAGCRQALSDVDTAPPPTQDSTSALRRVKRCLLNTQTELTRVVLVLKGPTSQSATPLVERKQQALEASIAQKTRDLARSEQQLSALQAALAKERRRRALCETALHKLQDESADTDARIQQANGLGKWLVDLDWDAREIAVVHFAVEGEPVLWDPAVVNPDAAVRTVQMLADHMRASLAGTTGVFLSHGATAGDVAFGCAADAAAWCVRVQRSLLGEPWPAELLAAGAPFGAAVDPTSVVFSGPRLCMGLVVGGVVRVGGGARGCCPASVRSFGSQLAGGCFAAARRVCRLAAGGEVLLAGTAFDRLGDSAAAAAGLESIAPGGDTFLGPQPLDSADCEAASRAPLSLCARPEPSDGDRLVGEAFCGASEHVLAGVDSSGRGPVDQLRLRNSKPDDRDHQSVGPVEQPRLRSLEANDGDHQSVRHESSGLHPLGVCGPSVRVLAGDSGPLDQPRLRGSKAADGDRQSAAESPGPQPLGSGAPSGHAAAGGERADRPRPDRGEGTEGSASSTPAGTLDAGEDAAPPFLNSSPEQPRSGTADPDPQPAAGRGSCFGSGCLEGTCGLLADGSAGLSPLHAASTRRAAGLQPRRAASGGESAPAVGRSPLRSLSHARLECAGTGGLHPPGSHPAAGLDTAGRRSGAACADVSPLEAGQRGAVGAAGRGREAAEAAAAAAGGPVSHGTTNNPAGHTPAAAAPQPLDAGQRAAAAAESSGMPEITGQREAAAATAGDGRRVPGAAGDVLVGQLRCPWFAVSARSRAAAAADPGEQQEPGGAADGDALIALGVPGLEGRRALVVAREREAKLARMRADRAADRRASSSRPGAADTPSSSAAAATELVSRVESAQRKASAAEAKAR